MADKWHVGRDGQPGRCHAVKGHCPYGDAEHHYETRGEAEAVVEASAARSSNGHGVLSKKSAIAAKAFEERKTVPGYTARRVRKAAAVLLALSSMMTLSACDYVYADYPVDQRAGATEVAQKLDAADLVHLRKIDRNKRMVGESKSDDDALKKTNEEWIVSADDDEIASVRCFNTDCEFEAENGESMGSASEPGWFSGEWNQVFELSTADGKHDGKTMDTDWPDVVSVEHEDSKKNLKADLGGLFVSDYEVKDSTGKTVWSMTQWAGKEQYDLKRVDQHDSTNASAVDAVWLTITADRRLNR